MSVYFRQDQIAVDQSSVGPCCVEFLARKGFAHTEKNGSIPASVIWTCHCGRRYALCIVSVNRGRWKRYHAPGSLDNYAWPIKLDWGKYTG